MAIEENKYEKIIDIINQPYTNKEFKPNIHGRHIFTEKALIVLDMPVKKDAFHGSSYRFLCFKDMCSVNGDIVVNRDVEKATSDKIIVESCTIKDIHMHPESIMAMIPGKEYRKESHIHFKCENKNYNNILRIAKFLREY